MQLGDDSDEEDPFAEVCALPLTLRLGSHAL